MGCKEINISVLFLYLPIGHSMRNNERQRAKPLWPCVPFLNKNAEYFFLVLVVDAHHSINPGVYNKILYFPLCHSKFSIKFPCLMHHPSNSGDLCSLSSPLTSHISLCFSAILTPTCSSNSWPKILKKLLWLPHRKPTHGEVKSLPKRFGGICIPRP